MTTEHTDKRYEEELKKLREEILYMGGLVEDQIQKAVKSLVDRDSELAQIIIERDHEVNRLDVDIDELCIKLLALHQPAGRDLRFITTGLKITTDLERIGDMAVNICERALELNQEPQLKPYIDIPRMARISQRMIRESLDAFVREDTELALKVCKDDDEVDQLNARSSAKPLRSCSKTPRPSAARPRSARFRNISSGSPIMPPISPRW